MAKLWRIQMLIVVVGTLLVSSSGIILEDHNVTLAVPETVMTWDGAVQYCQENGGYLATVTTDYVQSLLGTLMKVKAISFLWIGAREKESGWTWADDKGQGTFNAWAPGHPVNKGTEPACTFLRGSENYEWLDHPCAMQHAFICQMDIGSDACQLPGAFLFSAEDGGGACLILHQRAPCSWYKARERCVQAGGRLAVFHDSAVYAKLRIHLGEKLQVSGDYWIGLRDANLQWQQGGSVVRTWWEGGQPSRAGRCVQLEKFGDGVYLWANQDCGRTQNFVCQIHQHTPPVVVGPKSSAIVPDITPRWSCRTADRGPLHLSMEKFINSIIFQVIAFSAGVLVMLVPLSIACARQHGHRPDRLSIKPRAPSRSTLDLHGSTATSTAGSTRNLVGGGSGRQQLDPPPMDHLPHPPPAEENIYSIQPQSHDPLQGHLSEGHPPPPPPQGHRSYDLLGGHNEGQSQRTYDLPGAQPHGYVNNVFLQQPPNPPAKAHAQALAAQLRQTQSNLQSPFGQAHGQMQPRLQRQSQFEMSAPSPEETYEPPAEESVLYRV